jgi:hypothetical protein
MAIDANRTEDARLNERLQRAVACAKSLAPDRASRLLQMLPAVFQEDRSPGLPNFLGRFLLGFEQLLLGLDAAGPQCLAELGLEQTIDRLYRYFDPGAAPEGKPDADGGTSLSDDTGAPPDFLNWLAGWVALTLREDWDEQRQRRLIAQAVPLYRLRGTRSGVEKMLLLYTDPFDAKVYELPPFQIGLHSTVGIDTVIDGGAPFFFRVQINLPQVDLQQARLQDATARAIIDLQKPAHTYYVLTVQTPTFQIGVHSTVGLDTLVG